MGHDESRIRVKMMRARTRSKTEAMQAIKTAATLGNLAATRTVMMERFKNEVYTRHRYKGLV